MKLLELFVVLVMTLYAVRGLEKTSEEFRRGLVAVAQAIGVDETSLAAVISFETGGTFSPSIRNKTSGATGLLQFMPKTAQRMGTSTDALAKLTREQQLSWVQRYFFWNGTAGKMKTTSDVYAAVFAPGFVGAPEDAVMYRKPSQAYMMNNVLDLSKDGTITKGEAATYVMRIYQQAVGRGQMSVKEADNSLPFLLGIQVLRLIAKL